MEKIIKNILTLLIRIYRYILSPLFPMCCRFTPTCSEYSISAIEKYGTIKGLYFSIRRIMKCHPFNPGGYDPVK